MDTYYGWHMAQNNYRYIYIDILWALGSELVGILYCRVICSIGC